MVSKLAKKWFKENTPQDGETSIKMTPQVVVRYINFLEDEVSRQKKRTLDESKVKDEYRGMLKGLIKDVKKDLLSRSKK